MMVGRGLLKHKNPDIQVPEGFLSNVDENSLTDIDDALAHV